MLSLSSTTTVMSIAPRRAKLSFPAMPQRRWQQPELSVGSPCASLDLLGRYKCWSIKDKSPAHLVWKFVAKPITTLLEDQYEHLDAGGSELMVEMFMVGRKPGGSVPTILFSCESKNCRQKAIMLVQKKSILAAHPGVLMAECSRLPKPLAFGEDSDHRSLPPGVYLDGPLRACGTSILISSRERELPKKATIGGIVCIDDEFYGVTTAHAFLAPKQEHEDSKDDLEFSFFGVDDPFDSSDEDDESVEMTSQGKIASISSGSSQSPNSDEPEGYRHKSFTSSLRSGADEKDSIKLEFPGGEQEHSDFRRDPALVRLGSLFVSAGVACALDWALVKIEYPVIESLFSGSTGGHGAKVPPLSFSELPRSLASKERTIQSAPHPMMSKIKPAGLMRRLSDKTRQFTGHRRGSAESTIPIMETVEGLFFYPHSVASEPADVDVMISTGTDGAVQGKLSGVPSFSKVAGQTRFQQLLTVIRNEGDFHDGDCGSWAIDLRTGAVYGHIVSGYPETGTAYLVPAWQIFLDIQNSLGKSVNLISETLAARIDHEALARSGQVFKEKVVAQAAYVVDFDEENAYTHYFDRSRSTIPEVPPKQNITRSPIIDISKISRPPKKGNIHRPAYDADKVEKEVKKTRPRPAYVDDVDEEGGAMKGTTRNPSATRKPPVISAQAKKYSLTSSDSGYSSRKPAKDSSASTSTIPEDRLEIKEELELERRKSKTIESKKSRESSAKPPERRHRSSTDSKVGFKPPDPSHYGMPTTIRTGSSPKVSQTTPPIPLRPRVVQLSPQPMSNYAPNPDSAYGSGTRPPISTSTYFQPQRSSQPLYAPPYPHLQPQIIQHPFQDLTPAPISPYMHYAPPPLRQPGRPPGYNYFASQQQQRPLSARFASASPRDLTQAREVSYDNDGSYASTSETIRQRSSIRVAPRPTTGSKKAREYEDVPNIVSIGEEFDRAAMPPPARSRTNRPVVQYNTERPRLQSVSRDYVSYGLARDTEIVSIEPMKSIERRRRQSYYGDPPSSDSKSHGDTLRAVALYQADVAGPFMPLTADTLKMLSQRPRQRSRSRSRNKTSTHNSGSRDESDYKASASTRTTRSGGDNDENLTIKVTGQARVMVGGAAIDCNDGEKIQIVGPPTRAGADSGYGGGEMETLITRAGADSGYGGSIASEKRRAENPRGRIMISGRSNVSVSSLDTVVGKGEGKGAGGTALGQIPSLDDFYI